MGHILNFIFLDNKNDTD